MIQLSEDGKTLVIIQSWDDIFSRPGFKQKINPDEIKLKQIIGRYRNYPKQPCGLTSCGTQHNKGYLVVAEGGIETNIGHKCGKTIFGVDFQYLCNVFTRDTNAQRYRENIKAFQNRLSVYRDRVKSIAEGENNGDWCYEKMHWHASKGFEQATLDALYKRAKHKNNQVTQDILLSREERELAASTGNSSSYRTEILFIIAGLSSILTYKKLKSILHVSLGDEMNVFSGLNSETLNFSDLKTWNNWANRIESRIKEAQNIIDDCHRFLVKSNIDQIRKYKHHL